MFDEPDAPHISVAAGVIVGLLASLVQSFGLTIQRLSHIANEKLPAGERKRDWQRPLWLGGFAIFILSNVFGTLFQIGALPIVVLGPLGAVSLLWNAAFAKLVLGDEFTVHLVVGTVLIAGGAVLIGIFGVVPEQTHTLPELVRLYRRPAFIVWVSLLALFLAVILSLAHLSEWRLSRYLFSRRRRRLPLSCPGSPGRRRWKASDRGGMHASPPPHQPSSSFSSSSSLLSRADTNNALGRAVETVAVATESTPLLLESSSSSSRRAPEPEAQQRSRFRLSFAENEVEADSNNVYSPAPSIVGRGRTRPTVAEHSIGDGDNDEERSGTIASSSSNTCRRTEQTRLWVGAAYGATSGTLSGLCLLFTKTGIELLIMSIVGKTNEFGHFEPWLIIVVLLVCELFQLAYLNRALRVVGPTLVCPLAFCFYNTTSIVSGLIYYDQSDRLSNLEAGLVALGIAVLLGGVWIVSIKSSSVGDGPDRRLGRDDRGGRFDRRDENKNENGNGEDTEDGLDGPVTTTRWLDREECWYEEPDSNDELDGAGSEDRQGGGGDGLRQGDDSATEDDEPLEWRPRGFSIGLAASSPGFDLRPQHHHQTRHHPKLGSILDSTLTSPRGSTTTTLGVQSRGAATTTKKSQQQQQQRTTPELVPDREADGVAQSVTKDLRGAAPVEGRMANTALAKVRTSKRGSLSGSLYVGPPSPCPGGGGGGGGGGHRRSRSSGGRISLPSTPLLPGDRRVDQHHRASRTDSGEDLALPQSGAQGIKVKAQTWWSFVGA